jgi:hypothetical protein
MKNCLKCNKEFEPKKNTAKFCSTSCRVMYNRKHSKQSVTPVQMQVLYNSMLELIEKAKSEPMQPYFGVVTKDEVKWGETIKEPVKIKLKRSFATLQALINECQSMEDYLPLREEIEAAEHLTDKEKAILLRKR